jgi:hypothetical protein
MSICTASPPSMQHPASSITITAPQYSYPSSLTHFRIPFSNASTGKVTPATLMYNLPHRRPATLLPSAERLRQQHPATADMSSRENRSSLAEPAGMQRTRVLHRKKQKRRVCTSRTRANKFKLLSLKIFFFWLASTSRASQPQLGLEPLCAGFGLARKINFFSARSENGLAVPHWLLNSLPRFPLLHLRPPIHPIFNPTATYPDLSNTVRSTPQP